MTFHHWRTHFDAQAARPLPPVEVPALTPRRRLALTRSLAKFQLGESGEGRVAHEIDRVTLPGVDADYRASLKRFVAEEGRHARILGLMVNALGGTLLPRSWTERAFVHGRRLLGVRFKLVVLLAAEVIGIAFYGLLARALPPGPFASALEQICRDEEAHLRFHADFFLAQRARPLAHALLCAAWWVVGPLAALTVLVDHRDTLRAFGVPLGEAVGLMLARVREAAHRMGSPAALEALAVHR
ncbi:MAG: ferritin-like domain-containing protein [Myxococcaceae bacterium]|nr:ferritin-like domain-containing protein [Myxococcaceae bacterium]